MSIAVSSTPSGNPYIDGILYGTQWSGSITYSFADDLSDFGTYPYAISGFQQVSAAQQNAVQSILEGAVASGTAIFSFGSYSQIANIDISLAADPAGSSDITIGQTDMFDGGDLTTARVADFPLLSQGASGGDVWFGDNYDYRTPQVGSYAWATHIHELGHAMGLSHGHNAGTDIDGFKLAIPHDRDGMEFSVMTYRSFVGGLTNGYTNEQFGYAQTLMMYDIAAVQYLYGANFNTNSGGTTYTWSTTTGEMFVNGIGQGKPGDGVSAAANRLFLTIWDGGGEDTYDFSNYSDNGFIDLAPGGWSLVSQTERAYLGLGAYANGNVYNALLYQGDFRSLIENANGGSGNDEIAGNVGSTKLTGNGGDDVLVGRGNDDTLYGNDGADTLYGDFRTPATTYTGTGLFTENTANNGARETARDLTSAIGLHTDANFEHSDTNPSVAVTGTGDGGYDWYSFDVLAPGQLTLDTDGDTDTYIELYDASGNLLAYNDDSVSDTGDTGSSIDWKSFIAFTLTTPGQYFVKVGVYSSSGSGGAVIPNGLTYKLGIVLPNPVETDIGGSGNDRLYGGAGADKLFGGAGNDTLDGGADADLLDGGAGDDTYVLGGENDTVTDSAGIDTITSTITRSLAGYGTIEKLVLLGTGDINGTGNGLANTITGNSGKNVLDGGAGVDTLIGGAGDDTYVLGAESDTVSDSAGIDTITSTITRSLVGFSTVEKLVLLGTGDINGTGNGLVNTITGNSGKNILDGGAGIDTLIGGAGDDTYVLGTESDKVSDSAGIDTITSTISRSLAGYDTIEKLILLGTGDINGTGNGLVNTITGNSGKNILDGGAGHDTLIGGAGDDTYILGAESDTVSDSAGIDTITSTISRSLAGYGTIEKLVLLGTGDINGTGNALANTITGNSGKNVLNGGTGLDTLIGGAGDDTYVLGAENDKVSDSTGIDTITSTISRSLAGYGTIEKLTLLGSGNINGSGNALANTITGNSGKNILDGGAGHDTLIGGAGDDTYVLGAESDTVTDSAGIDTITSTITRSLAGYGTIENLTLLGSSYINGTGNALDNILSGNGGKNTLAGGNGKDTLKGNGGDDILKGDAGDDILFGGTGKDTLTGGANKDIFVFDTALGAGNVDHVTDFNVADDTIHLENAIFTALTVLGTLASGAFVRNTTGKAVDGDDRVIYETDTGNLFYDSNGSSSGGSVLFATLSKNLALTNHDFVIV